MVKNEETAIDKQMKGRKKDLRLKRKMKEKIEAWKTGRDRRIRWSIWLNRDDTGGEESLQHCREREEQRKLLRILQETSANPSYSLAFCFNHLRQSASHCYSACVAQSQEARSLAALGTDSLYT